MPSGSSRAVSPVAGSRPIRFVACRIARRQTRRRGWSSCGIARRRARQRGWSVMCRMACRRIACRRARHRIASRHVPARVGDLGVSAMTTVGRAERPSSAMSRPNSRREPTPPPAVYEHVFVCMAVAFYRVSVGGAAKADRWAATTHGNSQRAYFTTVMNLLWYNDKILNGIGLYTGES